MPFVMRGGVSISYFVEGDGPTIVKIPGLGADLKMSLLIGWNKLIPQHRFVYIDPRGHGESGRPIDRSAHSMEEYREDVRAVLDAHGVERAVFWGVSDGAEVACAFADAYPHRVAAIIDYDGWDDRDLCESPIKEGRLELSDRVRKMGWPALIGAVVQADGYSLESPLVKEFQTANPEMVMLELEEWTRWKGPVSILPRLSFPILRLLNGKREADEVDRIKKAAGPSTEMHIIRDASHMQVCIEPRRSVDLVRNFLSRLDL